MDCGNGCVSYPALPDRSAEECVDNSLISSDNLSKENTMPKPPPMPQDKCIVLTREAAKILGCSMKQIRNLALAGTIKSWQLGPKSFAYDPEELRKYKSEKEASRKAGTCRGKLPQGFSVYISPWHRKKKK